MHLEIAIFHSSFARGAETFTAVGQQDDILSERRGDNIFIGRAIEFQLLAVPKRAVHPMHADSYSSSGNSLRLKRSLRSSRSSSSSLTGLSGSMSWPRTD